MYNLKTNFNITRIAIIIVGLTNCTSPVNEIKPPVAAKIPYTHSEHGIDRVDNYFWMRLSEEQKLAEKKDEQTQRVIDYLEAENAYLKEIMEPTEPFQKVLYNEMIGRIKQKDESVPFKENGYWYITKYEEGQEYPIYSRKKGSLDAKEEVILNVNELAKGHNYYQVAGISVSEDSRWLAFGVDTVSRRRYTIYFKDLVTGAVSDISIPNTEGDVTWANDNKTLFYTKKDEVTLRADKIYRHTLGTLPDKDRLVFHEKDETFNTGIYKTKSKQFLVIGSGSTLTNYFKILDADKPEGDFKEFSPIEIGHEYSIDHAGGEFYIVTNWNAQNFRLMTTPDGKTSKENWVEKVAHRKEVLLEGVDLFKDYLALNERSNANSQLKIIHQKTGESHYLDFGEQAYTVYTSVNREFDTEIIRYGYTSMTTPISTYDYNMRTKEKTLLKQQEIVGGYDRNLYITERRWAVAKDQTKVPISLVYKKDLKKTDGNPLLLYAYGSYGYSMDPTFSSTRLSLLDRGFVFAIAHIRGGQELGRQWYEDGKMFKKINTFTDYIACAEYLIQEKFTEPKHLYAQGGSAGGLLMGAVVNMKPEIFHGVVAQVPFVDVVSTMLDESIPLTTGEFDEWGNPKNKDSFDYMLSYSPYDNVKSQDYPNILVTTGLHDSQVQYWEPAKWVAKLRELKTDKNILLMRTNMETGHGGTTGRFKVYEEVAQDYAFLLNLEGIKE